MHPKDLALSTKFPLSLHELGVPPRAWRAVWPCFHLSSEFSHSSQYCTRESCLPFSATVGLVVMSSARIRSVFAVFSDVTFSWSKRSTHCLPLSLLRPFQPTSLIACAVPIELAVWRRDQQYSATLDTPGEVCGRNGQLINLRQEQPTHWAHGCDHLEEHLVRDQPSDGTCCSINLGLQGGQDLLRLYSKKN